jgi:hypothetical protein
MSDNNSINLVNSQIDRERFRQARILFYSNTVVAALSASVTLLGASEMLIGNPQGTETMLGGLYSSVNSLRLMRSASDRVKNSSTRSND